MRNPVYTVRFVTPTKKNPDITVLNANLNPIKLQYTTTPILHYHNHYKNNLCVFENVFLTLLANSRNSYKNDMCNNYLFGNIFGWSNLADCFKTFKDHLHLIITKMFLTGNNILVIYKTNPARVPVIIIITLLSHEKIN